MLAQRRQLAITAARVSPPPYISKELRERPSDPAKRKAWDRGVEGIERYRQQHGVKDLGRAFGREAERGSSERARWRRGADSTRPNEFSASADTRRARVTSAVGWGSVGRGGRAV